MWKAFPQLTVFDAKTVTLGSVTYYVTIVTLGSVTYYFAIVTLGSVTYYGTDIVRGEYMSVLPAVRTRRMDGQEG